jgi:hypothetical protein
MRKHSLIHNSLGTHSNCPGTALGRNHHRSQLMPGMSLLAASTKGCIIVSRKLDKILA